MSNTMKDLNTVKKMTIDRRDLMGLSLGLLGGAGVAALSLGATKASAQGGFIEGRHFVKLAQAQTVSAPAGKIEVLEFFSYGCPHCSAFEPSLDAWAKKLPADVVFRRIPVNFLANYENFQRLYFSLDAMGQVDALQSKVFAAVHVQRERLATPEAIADLVAKNGVDRAKFLEMFNSFGVQSKTRLVPALVSSYKLDGVPALAVQGRFVTSPSMAGGEGVSPDVSHQRVLQLVDQLIARTRKGA